MAHNIEKGLLAGVLCSLGVSCGGADTVEHGGEGTVEYGTPYINFRISGRVTDTQSRPIAGIQVADANRTTEPITTDADGKYTLTGTAFSPEYCTIQFDDTDGTANGGEFASQTVNPQLSDANRTEKGKGWYGGKYEKDDVNAQLAVKK